MYIVPVGPKPTQPKEAAMPHRQHVNKQKAAKHFRKQSHHTKNINVAAPMRGGWRL